MIVICYCTIILFIDGSDCSVTKFECNLGLVRTWNIFQTSLLVFYERSTGKWSRLFALKMIPCTLDSMIPCKMAHGLTPIQCN